MAVLCCTAVGRAEPPTILHDDGIHDFRDGIMTGPLFLAELGTCTTDPLETPTARAIYCPDCGCGAPCVAGSGAYAFCIGGTWTCVDSSPTCLGHACATDGQACVNNIDCCTASCVGGVCAPLAPCSQSCVADGGACVHNVDCCSAACLTGVCGTLNACDLLTQVAACPEFCTDVNDCPCATTTTTTTTTTLATTTTTTTTTSTTTGSASTTTTTSGSTTSTTVDFASSGWVYTQDLLFGVSEVFGIEGVSATTTATQPIVSPAHGTAKTMSCDANGDTPGSIYAANHGSGCTVGVNCPVWTACLMQSNVPWDPSLLSDTAACCHFGVTDINCQADVSGNSDIKEGGLLDFHGTVTISPTDVPRFFSCSVVLE